MQVATDANREVKPMEQVQITLRLPSRLRNKISCLVQKGLFLNQSDFIRTAIRKQLETEEKKNNVMEATSA